MIDSTMNLIFVCSEVGWLQDSPILAQEFSGSIAVRVGVIEGAEQLQENITLSVESSPSSK